MRSTALASFALVLLTLPSAQTNQAQQASPPAGPPAGIAPELWKRAGSATRWVLYRNAMDRRATTKEEWVKFLSATKEFDTLEAMCIYEGFRGVFQKGNPGAALVLHNAPHRMRVGLWNLSNFDSHNVEASASPLTNEPAVFLAWAKKYPAVRALGGANLLNRFSKVQPGDAGDLLPPLDPAVILLPVLDAPRQLSRLTPGEAFDPKRRYRFQVLRAIRALSVAGKHGVPYQRKLLRLTRHQDPLVRRTAMLEFSKFPSRQIPWSELLGIADNTSLDAADRSTALLAASYASHPAVTLALHRVLKTPKHPAFEAIVGRMHQIGTAMTDRVLDDLPQDSLPEPLRARVAALHKLLARNGARNQPQIYELVFLIVWTEFTKDPLLPVVKAWTEPHLQRLVRAKGGGQELRDLMKNPGMTGARRFLHEKIQAEIKRLQR